MADQNTEKPTPRRLEGNFASSRELIAAGQFLIFVCLLWWWSLYLLNQLKRALRDTLQFERLPQIDVLTIVAETRVLAARIAVPMLAAASLVVFFSLAVQLSITRFGFAPKKLFPDFGRLNPARRLRTMYAQNLFSLLQAAALITLCLAAVWQYVRANLGNYIALQLVPPAVALALVASAVGGLLWKTALLLVVVGMADLVRQKRTWTRQLMMTKQEVREELKESEGNPQIKMRIRRIQRDLARRNMMKAVRTATAVVVNPTHYAVAIHYDMGQMPAPKVVAKGRNYLALRIRQIAIENQVPVVENKPLAQGLYKAVDVGQDIPAHMYKAVAEILAYIYRLMHPQGQAV